MNKHHQPKPSICMLREKKIYEKILHFLKAFEPVMIIGMRACGKDIFYETLKNEKEKLEPLAKYSRVDFVQGTSPRQIIENLVTYENLLTNGEKNLLFVLDIYTSRDCLNVLEKIETLRKKYGSDFNYVVFSYVGPLLSAIEKTKKPLSRNYFPLLPVDRKDTKLLLKDLSKRFSFTLNNKFKEKIYKLSGGHVGLIKSLYLLSSQTKDIPEPEDLINEEKIKYRLVGILEELKPKYQEALFEISTTGEIKAKAAEAEVLENLGYIKKEEDKLVIFSPLLDKYIRKNYLTPQTIKNKTPLIFSPTEEKVFKYLLDNMGNIVSRDKIAKIMWDDNEEKYSDWALDQLIYSIRKKIKQNLDGKFMILTKKKRGFLLKE